ncbi:cryptochrome/photolyase family protein [Maricaulis sp. CAU 1757]
MATTSDSRPALVWFRRDLRLDDNPALRAAAATGRPLILAFIRDSDRDMAAAPGAAADWWLHHSLASLQRRLGQHNGGLVLRHGDSEIQIPGLAQDHDVADVFWNSTGLPWLDARDESLAQALRDSEITPHRFHAATLLRPDEVSTKSGTPYKVFTPFWRQALEVLDVPEPKPAPDRLRWASPYPDGDALDDWQLVPTQPDWAAEFADHWTPGESAAVDRLEAFLDSHLVDYPEERDRPDHAGTSRLSPHINWGELSVRTIWHRVQARVSNQVTRKAADKFLAEIGWREFAFYLFHHFGDLRRENFNQDYNAFPWRNTPERLEAWQRGQTGIPMVDAGMRELWATGWMHNRVRMIVGSYLVKHLNCHWQAGMEWFEDTLVDAEPAVNAASWQWVAGSGADASPFYRIFNPARQGERFDPDGSYVRRWVPEIADLPNADIHAPWDASRATLDKAGIKLGQTYPRPYVELDEGREAALQAYQELKDAKKQG